ncbi:MAG: hypothetical protein ACNA70_07680 [Brevefilum sp.]
MLKNKFESLVKRWGKVPIALTITLILLISVVAIAIAAEYVISPTTPMYEINGAIFKHFVPTDASGTGVFDPFLRIQKSNQEVVQGYNSDFRPVEFEETSAWTESLLLSDVPMVLYEGVLYREFQLDINQVNNDPKWLLSLDEVQIWLGGTDAALITGFVPGENPTDFGTFPGFILEEVYNLDADEDNHVKLNYTYGAGSGKRNLKMLVPDANFGEYDEACIYLGEGCEQYVVFYTMFGMNFPNNDGFEEWGVEVYNIVKGYKWHDMNANGIWDEGEPGLEGWQICAVQVGYDPICVLTRADGSYVLPLPAGNYTIFEECESEWFQSYPAPTGGVCGSGVYDENVKSGDLLENRNFGNYQWIPDIEIIKTGDPLSKVGDTINYEITVTNTSSMGTPDLYCNITDPLMALDTHVTLATGASTTLYPTYVVQGGDPDPLPNTASVSCTYVGDSVVQATDSDDHSVNLFQPAIALTKTGDELSKIGDLVDYTITLYNNSSMDTPNLECTVTDPLVGVNESFTIASGAEPKVITVTDFEIPVGASDPFVNIASASCSPVGFPNILPATAQHSINLFQPSITFTKTAVEEYSKAGDTVHYTITLTNTSSMDTPNLECTITDTMLGINQPVTLASGAAPYVLTPSYVVQVGDADPLVNTANVTCSPIGFPNILPASDFVSVDLVHPAFTLTKTCMTEHVIPGENATFQVVFTNIGDVPLVVVFDEGPDAGVPIIVPVGGNSTFSVYVPADTDPGPSVVSNTVNAHVTLPEMYGLSNYWDPVASDSCDIYGVKSGYKWEDMNADGAWDDLIEPVLPGWKIHFYAWDAVAMEWEATYVEVLTGVDGKYEFNMVMPGVTYAVCEVLEAGYVQTFPDVILPAEGFVDCTQFGAGYGPVGYEIMLVSGEYEVDNDFGNFRPMGCTYTQGYWKTHSTYGPAGPYDPTWDLKAGGDAYFLSDAWYVDHTWYTMFWTPPAGGNAYIILAHQYMAAWLSINNVDPLKAANPAVLGSALAEAEALLGAYTPADILEPAVREQFIALASFLDQFNNGELPGGPPHCE